MVVEEGVQDDGEFEFFLFGIVNKFYSYVGEIEPVGFFISIDLGYLKHVSVGDEVGIRALACPIVIVLDRH